MDQWCGPVEDDENVGHITHKDYSFFVVRVDQIWSHISNWSTALQLLDMVYAPRIIIMQKKAKQTHPFYGQ